MILANDKDTKPLRYLTVFGMLGVASDDIYLILESDATPLKIDTLVSMQPTGVFVSECLAPIYQFSFCTDKNWLNFLHRSHIPCADYSAEILSLHEEQLSVAGK